MIFPQTPPANADREWNAFRWVVFASTKSLKDGIGKPSGNPVDSRRALCLIASFGNGGQRGFPTMVLDFCAMIDYNNIN